MMRNSETHMFQRFVRNVRHHLFEPLPAERHTRRIKDRIRKVRYNLFGDMPVLGRRRRPGESHKARARRERDGLFDRYFQGAGLDVGYGGDPVVPGVTGWDFEHGDAQLLKSLGDESFDFVYSSHLLEHMVEPELALRNWWRVLKPGGYLILYLPHRDLYEKKRDLPSQFNEDHKHFFLPERDEAPDTLGLVPLLDRALGEHDVVHLRTCDDGYRDLGPERQSEGEFSIEVITRKPAAG